MRCLGSCAVLPLWYLTRKLDFYVNDAFWRWCINADLKWHSIWQVWHCRLKTILPRTIYLSHRVYYSTVQTNASEITAPKSYCCYYISCMVVILTRIFKNTKYQKLWWRKARRVPDEWRSLSLSVFLSFFPHLIPTVRLEYHPFIHPFFLFFSFFFTWELVRYSRNVLDSGQCLGPWTLKLMTTALVMF